MTIGLAVLAGWLFDLRTLQSVNPRWVTMKANTAVGLTLAGFGLLLLGRPTDTERTRWGVRAAGAAVATLGALTLVEWLLGIELGVDQLLFADAANAVGTGAPGRMAPVTAACLAGLGGGLLLGSAEDDRAHRAAQWLALAVAVATLLALLGYLFGVRSLYGVAPYTSIAVHTALTLLVLAVGLLLVRPDVGLVATLTSATGAGQLARRLLPAVLAVPIVLGWLRLQGEQAGWYDGRFGLAMFVVVNVVTLGAVTLWAVRALRRRESEAELGLRAIHRSEAALRASLAEQMKEQLERTRAESALRDKDDQLRQAQKMEAIGSLAGGVAHDFNNLLSVILCHTQLMIGDLGRDDPLRDDLTEIKRAGERAAVLTRQLLAFSRQQVMVPQVVDLNDVIDGMTKMLGRLIGEDVDLTLRRQRELGRTRVDPGQIEQVLANLVVNARDAMPRGGNLRIETANLDARGTARLGVAPGDYVVLRVTDDGQGMDEATRIRVFEPFFTTKAQGKGTGLGLAVVFGIVQQSGGHIWVRSELGAGTTFELWFPRVAAEPATSPSPRPSGELARGSETILLIEDDEQVRAVARDVLRRNGYFVLSAASAADALLISEQHAGSIDLVLTDVVMPRMNGRELVERVSAARPGTKALLMSGYTDDAMVRHGVQTAELAFIEKPLQQDTLLRKVREVLDDAPAATRQMHAS